MNKLYYIGSTTSTSMTTLLDKLGWRRTLNSADATLWIPVNYTTIEQQLMGHSVRIPVRLGLRGCDQLVSKELLFSQVYYPIFRSSYIEYLPPTYLYPPPLDPVAVTVQYIAKRNVQRKQGIQLIRNQADMDAAGTVGSVVYQQYVQRPLLCNGYKVNIRSYILVVIKLGSRAHTYRFSHAKCIYTAVPYAADSTDQRAHITSIGLDHTIYDRCPYFWTDDGTLLKAEKVAGALMTRHLYGCGVQYFGLDWIIDTDTGRILLLEINKGPDMYPKFEAEREYKEAVLTGVLAVVGLEQMHPVYRWERIN